MIQTIIVAIILAAAAVFVVRGIMRTVKGKGGCGCGCDNCPMKGDKGCRCNDSFPQINVDD